MPLIDLANPSRFLALTERLLPWLAGATVLALAFGLYMAGGAPDDYQQGATAKIMFIHVPSAWLSMGCWTLMSLAALGTLVWRHPLADVSAKAAAPIGAAFTFICLTTGMLWGRPMWGTYWVWDARLTSMLLLFFLFLGHIALSHAYDNAERGDRAEAGLRAANSQQDGSRRAGAAGPPHHEDGLRADFLRQPAALQLHDEAGRRGQVVR